MSRPSTSLSFSSIGSLNMPASSSDEGRTSSTVNVLRFLDTDTNLSISTAFNDTSAGIPGASTSPVDENMQTVNDDSTGLSAEDTAHTVSSPIQPVGPSVERHAVFYMNYGTVTLLVEGKLFLVERYFFQRDSDKFQALFAQYADTPFGKSDEHPIELKGTSSLDFERFLAILYPVNFNTPPLSTADELASALRIAHNWGFASIHTLMSHSLFSVASSIDKVVFGHEFGLDEWLLDAYVDLCTRDEGLSLQQAERLGLSDVVKIWNLRQAIWRGEIIGEDTVDAVRQACCPQTHDDIISMPPHPKTTSSAITRGLAKVEARKESAMRAQRALDNAERELQCAREEEARIAEENAARRKELVEYSSLQSRIETRKAELEELDKQVTQSHRTIHDNMKRLIATNLQGSRLSKVKELELAVADIEKWRGVVSGRGIAANIPRLELKMKKKEVEHRYLVAEAQVTMLATVEVLLSSIS